MGDSKMDRAPKICFVEGQGYGVLDSGTRQATTGGESVQHALLAQEFVARGWSVSMVSRDIGQIGHSHGPPQQSAYPVLYKLEELDLLL